MLWSVCLCNKSRSLLCFSILHVLSHDFTQRDQFEWFFSLHGTWDLLNKLVRTVVVDPQIFFALKSHKNTVFIYISDNIDHVSLFFLEKILLSHYGEILLIYFNLIHTFVGTYQEQPWIRGPRNYINMALFILKLQGTHYLIGLNIYQCQMTCFLTAGKQFLVYCL